MVSNTQQVQSQFTLPCKSQKYSREALERISRRAQAVPKKTSRLAVLLLPGSLNPVHCDHVHCLLCAREQLEMEGMVVLASFLQSSADCYVQNKLGREAMSLKTRVEVCDLAAASDERNGSDG